MARPRKTTIDYYPHDVHDRKTIKIIEHQFGLSGYGFWFKLLSFLGRTPYHYYHIKDDICLKFLASETLSTEGFCYKILDLLARLEAIDRELWEKKVIWSQNFVDRIQDAYAGRLGDVPVRPDPETFLAPETLFLDQETPFPVGIGANLAGIDPGNPQSKVKEIKGKEIKRNSVVENEPPQNDLMDNSVDDELFDDPPGSKPQKPKRSIAVIRYHELTNVRPNKVQIDLIDSNVNDDNLEDWVTVIKEWLGHNWNKTNVADMIKCLNNGGVKNGSNYRRNGNTTNQGSGSARNDRNTAESWKT